jgi:2-oxoglutarate ferredoxin oxidoreductase subunit alpha
MRQVGELQEKRLLTGNEAIAEAAIKAGCRYFFGYPITPQNKIPEYFSKRLPEVGGVYLQAESEIAAINMVFGAAGAGARVMTSSSSPGISLMQEGISYIAAAELPCVIVNIMRGGPGLGGIQPAQSDYFQATKGGGHGDYHLLVLAPSTVQEAANLTMQAFDLADKYRNPVMILGDGYIGQMMEPVRIREKEGKSPKDKSWALTGAKGRSRNLIRTCYLNPKELEQHNRKIHNKYEAMMKDERLSETYETDADIIIVAFGTVARISKTAIDILRSKGLKVGLMRPITLFPFPSSEISMMADDDKKFIVIEMNMGQMVEDVRISVRGKSEVHFYGRTGGVVPTSEEIVRVVQKIVRPGNR